MTWSEAMTATHQNKVVFRATKPRTRYKRIDGVLHYVNRDKAGMGWTVVGTFWKDDTHADDWFAVQTTQKERTPIDVQGEDTGGFDGAAPPSNSDDGVDVSQMHPLGVYDTPDVLAECGELSGHPGQDDAGEY